MKKIIILTFVSLAFLVTSIALAGTTHDDKILASAVKKIAELKIQLNLSPAQEKKVQEILFNGFKNTRMVYDQQDLSKEQKIVKYNEISGQTQAEMKKALTVQQYDKYLSPARGH